MTPAVLSSPMDLLVVWSTHLWPACWQGALVVLGVWAIVGLVRSMPARYQCWLWRLAMLKFILALVLPPLVTLPLLPAPAIGAHVEARLPVVTTSPVRQAVQVHGTPTRTDQWPSLATVLCFAWLIGIGCSGVRFARDWNAARQLRRRGRTIVSGPTLGHLEAQTRLFGLRTVPRLIEVPGGGSPMLVGTFRPAVVIPSETWRRLSVRERAMVVGHELAHIRRGDLLWGLMASLVRSVFFFHPLVWWCERQLRLAQEVAADELAIARQNHDPIGYGSLLVSVVGKLGLKRGPRPLASIMLLETAGPIDSLTRRLVAMSRIGRTSRRALVGSGVLLGAVVLLGILPWRLVAAEAKPTRYLARIVVSEIGKDQAKKTFVAPQLTYLGGSMLCMERADGTSTLRVSVSSQLDKQPIEHVIETKITRYPDVRSLKGMPAPPISFRSPDEANRALAQMSAEAKEAMIHRNKAWTEAMEKNAVVFTSPKLFVLDGKTGKVTMPDGNGAELEIEVTVSPIDEAAQVASGTKAADPQPSQMVDGAKMTLADYEAIPNPKDPGLGQRPYRMDGKSYGIVVSKDAEGQTRVAGVNKRTGEWKWLDLPKNNQISFEPIMGNDVTGLILHGEPLSQLVVYNGRLNKWSSFPLQDRVIDVVPCVGDRVVCYQLHDRVVAYSAAHDAWGMLRTEAVAAVGDEAICVETANGRYEFPGKSGVWTAAKTSAAATY